MSRSVLLSHGFQLVWLAWILTWILAAGWSATTRLHQSPRERLLHLVPLLLGGGLYFMMAPPDTLIGRRLVPEAEWIAWSGLGMTAAGLGFAVWARITLGTMWSGRVTLKEDHALIRRGPYALVRHPIYTGLLLALLGTALARGT
ncbi:MAG TPA: isoprenylcysteine carboxylmethyltransferase family protein, partial [Gemmatimonadales bacterium]|nr:isoprenylcysteine carboxylmethyltransferase family protein [Gemmatimonadales bacterium]